jgi:hypothetical protein
MASGFTEDSGPKISTTRTRQPADAEGEIEAQRPGLDGLDAHRCLFAHPHDGPFSELLVDGCQRHIECLSRSLLTVVLRFLPDACGVLLGVKAELHDLDCIDGHHTEGCDTVALRTTAV